MGRRNREIQVGLLTILAVVVFLVGLLWFKQVRIHGHVVGYQVEFPQVASLQKGDRVLVRGIRMGAVDDMRLTQNGVVVTFQVDHSADLRQNADIQLQTTGIVGEKVMDIDPGSGPAAPPGHLFQGQVTPDITQLGGSAAEALKQMDSLAKEMQATLAELRTEGGLTQTLAAARNAAEGVSELVATNQKEISELIANLAQTSQVLRESLSAPGVDLAGTARDARTTLVRADTVLANLLEASQALRGMLTRIERGEGTAGRLVQDRALYDQLERTLSSVQELIQDIRRNPQAFFKVNLLGF